MLSAGLKKLFSQVVSNLDNKQLLKRYLELLGSVEDEILKANSLVSLAGHFRYVDAIESLRLLLMVIKFDPRHEEALNLTASIMTDLGESESAEKLLAIEHSEVALFSSEAAELSLKPEDKNPELDFAGGIDFSDDSSASVNEEVDTPKQHKEDPPSSSSSSFLGPDLSQKVEDSASYRRFSLDLAPDQESKNTDFSVKEDELEKNSPLDRSGVEGSPLSAIPDEMDEGHIDKTLNLSEIPKRDFTYEPHAVQPAAQESGGIEEPFIQQSLSLGGDDLEQGSSPPHSMDPLPLKSQIKTDYIVPDALASIQPDITSKQSDLAQHGSDNSANEKGSGTQEVIDSHSQILSELFDFYYGQRMFGLASQLLEDAKAFAAQMSWWRARKVVLERGDGLNLNLAQPPLRARSLNTEKSVNDLCVLMENHAHSEALQLIEKINLDNMTIEQACYIYECLEQIWQQNNIKGFHWRSSDGIQPLINKIRENSPPKLSALLDLE